MKRPFRDGIFQMDPPRLLGSACDRCGNTSFPPRSYCPSCGNVKDLRAVTLGPVGTIYSFTVVRQAPPDAAVPYTLAYVDLPEGVRVLSRIVGPQGRCVIGARAQLELVPMSSAVDGELIGFAFRPLSADADATLIEGNRT